jgi:hypothetical protein
MMENSCTPFEKEIIKFFKYILNNIIAIATILTAYATYKTVDEMQISRKLEYQPYIKLHVSDNTIYASNLYQQVLFNFPIFYSIDLNNYGTNAAFDINIDYNSKNLKDTNSTIYIDVIDKKYTINLPVLYARAYENYLKLRYIESKKYNFKVDTWINNKSRFSPLYFTIKYQNLNKKAYKQKFKLSIPNDDIMITTKHYISYKTDKEMSYKEYKVNVKFNVQEINQND